MKSAQPAELRPVGRYEWEQIIRRARLGGVIAGSANIGRNGKQTRGAMSATRFKGIALVWSSYASDKGDQIWPGDATVAVAAEVDLKDASAVRKALVDLGLLQKVRAGARRSRKADEYRLTFPEDLIERLEILTPAQMTVAADRLREAARGKPRPQEGSGGPTKDDSMEGPVDPAEPDVTGPVDPPQVAPAAWQKGSGGPAHHSYGGSGGPALGGPPDPPTDHDRTSSTTTDHCGDDVRTDLAVARTREADQDPIFRGDDESGSPPAAGPCEHGMPPSIRCPACRRGLTGTSDPAVPDNVVPLRRRAVNARQARSASLATETSVAT